MIIKKILKSLREKINMRKFIRNCTYGTNLVVRYTAKCLSERPENICIGDNCEIKGCLMSYNKGKITIGNNCFISFSTLIGAMDAVNIGNDVIISTNVRIFDNNNHPVEPEMRRKMSHSDFYGELWEWKYSKHKPVIIEDNVWIGEYAAILKGVRVGRGSIVASHSVVTKDVPEYTVVAGNPARVVKKIKKENSE